MSRLARRPAVRVVVAIAGGLFLAACSSSTPRIQSDFVPAGSLRLAQVVQLATRREVIELAPLREILRSSGVGDAEIVDGSVAVARIYCCGGPNEESSARMVYVPASARAAVGDVVEVRVGHVPQGGDHGALNTVTRVRQAASDTAGPCQWLPRNDRLWRRILYADWMAKEGWVKQDGLWTAWYRPPPTASGQ